jgi:hypothetical protein
MIDYVVTLAVTITQIDVSEGSQKTVLRKVSTGAIAGVAAAKAAYDSFLSDLSGSVYTEDDTTQTTTSHTP